MKKIVVCLFASLFFCTSLLAVEPFPYEIPDQKDRFSFAQLYLSIDAYQYRISSPYTLEADERETKNILGSGLTIGGLHYWGAFDFYVSFPFRATSKTGGAEQTYSPGIETGLRYYPIAITNKKILPFLGWSFAFPVYQQDKKTELQKIVYPYNAGLTYARNPFLIDLGVKYTQNNNFFYYLTEQERREVEVAELSYFLSFRWLKDTTLSARKDEQKDLEKGIYYYWGLGASSSWLTEKDDYIEQNSPAFSITENPSVFPEFSLGFVIKRNEKKGYRSIFNIAQRNSQFQQEGFDKKAIYKNNSTAIEFLYSFWDYHGFVPFVGPSYAINNLRFQNEALDLKETVNSLGVIFGWDILPTHRTRYYLRTALRYYPKIALEVAENKEILFPNFEFNFIQYVRHF